MLFLGIYLVKLKQTHHKKMLATLTIEHS